MSKHKEMAERLLTTAPNATLCMEAAALDQIAAQQENYSALMQSERIVPVAQQESVEPFATTCYSSLSGMSVEFNSPDLLEAGLKLYLHPEEPIDKSKLKRLVTQVFGEGYTITSSDELAKLRAELMGNNHNLKAAEGMRDQALKEMNEAYEAADKLRAENERLASDRDAKSSRMWELGKECDTLFAEREKLKIELREMTDKVAKLREALERIANGTYEVYQDAEGVARAALKGESNA